MTTHTILYHKHCADGSAAALAAWLALGDHEARPLGPEQVRLRHPARVVEDLGVAEVVVAGVAHDVDVAPEQRQSLTRPTARLKKSLNNNDQTAMVLRQLALRLMGK